MQTLNLAFSVHAHARLAPTDLALAVDGLELSYGELAARARRVAGWLASLGAVRVGVLAARSVETYVGILGAAWAGCTYVAMNPKLPPAWLRLILERARLDALVADARGAGQLEELSPLLPPQVLAGARWDELPEPLEELPVAPVRPDGLAYILFTSGTTGVPKGVEVTAANVAHLLACIRAQYHLVPTDRVGQFSEISFDVSVFEMFGCWQAGASLHVVPETKVMAPAGFIRERALTVWSSVPSIIPMLERLRHLSPGALPTLRISYFAGEGLPVEAARAWQRAAPGSVIDNQYGPTEGTVTCISQRFAEPPAETPGRGMLAIGVPYPGTSAAIVGDGGRFLAAGEIGELALSGPQVTAGYLDDPEQTARRFPTLSGARWYLTGDLAMRDELGRFHHLGRVDNQIKVLGNRIELEEIEAHLRSVCCTDAVAAMAWPIVDGNAAGVVAFVAQSRVPAGEAREALRERLPAYMVPRRLIGVETLPLSTNGKVDRQALRELLARMDDAARA